MWRRKGRPSSVRTPVDSSISPLCNQHVQEDFKINPRGGGTEEPHPHAVSSKFIATAQPGDRVRKPKSRLGARFSFGKKQKEGSATTGSVIPAGSVPGASVRPATSSRMAAPSAAPPAAAAASFGEQPKKRGGPAAGTGTIIGETAASAAAGTEAQSARWRSTTLSAFPSPFLAAGADSDAEGETDADNDAVERDGSSRSGRAGVRAALHPSQVWPAFDSDDEGCARVGSGGKPLYGSDDGSGATGATDSLSASDSEAALPPVVAATTDALAGRQPPTAGGAAAAAAAAMTTATGQRSQFCSSTSERRPAAQFPPSTLEIAGQQAPRQPSVGPGRGRYPAAACPADGTASGSFTVAPAPAAAGYGETVTTASCDMTEQEYGDPSLVLAAAAAAAATAPLPRRRPDPALRQALASLRRSVAAAAARGPVSSAKAGGGDSLGSRDGSGQSGGDGAGSGCGGSGSSLEVNLPLGDALLLLAALGSPPSSPPPTIPPPGGGAYPSAMGATAASGVWGSVTFTPASPPALRNLVSSPPIRKVMLGREQPTTAAARGAAVAGVAGGLADEGYGDGYGGGFGGGYSGGVPRAVNAEADALDEYWRAPSESPSDTPGAPFLPPPPSQQQYQHHASSAAAPWALDLQPAAAAEANLWRAAPFAVAAAPVAARAPAPWAAADLAAADAEPVEWRAPVY